MSKERVGFISSTSNNADFAAFDKEMVCQNYNSKKSKEKVALFFF
jgi:hypothetical protein